MHFLATDINKGCTRIQHRQVTHSSPYVLMSILVRSPAKSPTALRNCKPLQREAQCSPKCAIARDLNQPHGRATKCTRGSCGHNAPGGTRCLDTVFMACVQRRFRSWELMVRRRIFVPSRTMRPDCWPPGLILRDAREERAP